MKKISFILVVISTFILVSCDKGDMEVKKLNRGEGIWSITSMRYETYDSLGVNVVSTTTREDIGEFVFFQNTTLSGLYDEHLVVVNINDTSGVIRAYSGGVYYDDSRVKIDADGSGVSGVWTIIDNGRRKQEWALHVTHPSGSLGSKTTLYMKKK
ncbi:MAG TPA: hypothetical protein VK826_15015 [Bacteroidia bacterium]|nr:hypothetical protein [Bacteroidia bacterium]